MEGQLSLVTEYAGTLLRVEKAVREYLTCDRILTSGSLQTE